MLRIIDWQRRSFRSPGKTAENKTKATHASVEAFLAGVPDAGKRADALTLIALMEGATGEKPVM